MKKFLLTFGIVILCFTMKAQSYVTIPDSNFVTWLNINVPSAMSGNQMDTSSSAVTSLSVMNISFDSIFDLSGVKYFKGLQVLNCSYNYMDTLAQLPDSLKILNCSHNYLTLLPALPTALQSFDCQMNALTWLPTLPATILSFNCSQNQLDSLPALPPLIPNLYCNNNLLTSLPAFPSSLITIDCSTNELDSLPALPLSLQMLTCSNNLLTSLPALPASLTALYCNTNQLTVLPVLPSGIITLECYQNQIPALPVLPLGLQYLTCSANPLGVLPSLPATLIELKCYSDSLTVLPSLPSSLTYLDCNSNSLTVIPVLPSSLVFLNCAYNQIPVLPALASLQTLMCASNLLSTIPTIPSTLQILYCGSNPLVNLPSLNSISTLECPNATLDSLPALPATLTFLDCQGNYLDSLPALPANLYTLYCQNNQLVLLPTLNGSLSYLDCSGNILSALPSIPAGMNTLYANNNVITCLPELPNSLMFLSLYGNAFTCLPNYIPAMDSLTLLTPLCIYGDLVNNPNNCPSAQGLVGFTYTDADSDCSMDSFETKLVNIPVTLYDNLGMQIGKTYTASNGVYSFAQPAGTYTAAVDTTSVPFIPQCMNPGVDTTVTTTVAAPLATDLNFDFNCKPGYDVGIHSIYTNVRPFPGETHELRVWAGDMTQWYKMACAAGISGTVQIKVTGPVTYVGPTTGALTPSITGSIYTYTISDFSTINNATAFGLKFYTDTLAATGTKINVAVAVTPIGGDNDTANNNEYYTYRVVNSHDPNYKETSPQVVTPSYTDYFTYAIHFQNTGTAAAINIKVMDTLDNNLDLTTFQVMNYSHSNITTLSGNVIKFNFPGINLADSTSSADSSKGFIQYRIKAKPGMTVGTIIRNTAYIYFDYNEPVITNTTFNIYEAFAGISESISEENVEVYPNPATDHITVNFKSTSKNAGMKIYDVTGRIVAEQKNIPSGKTEIPVSDFERGLYFISISDGENSITKKFIKQ